MLNNISKILFPHRCPACGDVMEDDGTYIHSECREQFKLIREPRCFKCGRTLQNEEDDICYECRKKQHSYKYGLALFEYNGIARRSMIDYKAKGIRRNGEFYADEMVRELGRILKTLAPEVLIPVPISGRKLRERGFNQSEFIAKILGAGLDIPVDADVLFRTGKSNVSQKQLSGKERSKKIKTSFECVDDMPYKNICIVDDIYTTGNTIEACTLALMNAGAENVGFIVAFSGDMF